MSDRMNEPFDDPTLKKLEARLAERLVVRPTTIDRDQLLYRAGWEAAKEKRPVAAWRWPLATGVMTAATVALVFLQIDTQRRLEGLEQQAATVAAMEEIAPEPEFIPPPKPLPTLQKRPAWPLLAAWGLAPEPIRRERGTALSARWMLRDGIDPLEEWDRTRLVHTTSPSDSSDRPFPTRQPATARELMKEWFPPPVRPVPVRAAPSPGPSTDPAQQRARNHPATGGSLV